MTIKKVLKDLWYFIWKEDSLLSWIVNVCIAFLIVKFVIYPVLSLLLGTGLPIVAVVSGSMEHDNNFDQWWSEHEEFYTNLNIDYEEFKDYRFKNGFNKGDIMILVNAKNLRRGDVLVFLGNTPAPIIHRIVRVGEKDYQTKGDHNSQSRADELSINQERILGKAILRIPYLGWLKILFVSFLNLLGF